MSKHKQKPKKIVSTSFKTRKQKQSEEQVRFNITKLAYNYMVAKKAMMIFEQRGVKDSATFFSGVLRGYDDWWEEAGITQDKFNDLQGALDMDKNTADARELVDSIIKQKTPLVHMPGQTLTGVEEKAVKELFKRNLGGKI